jgi:hypothetical protein
LQALKLYPLDLKSENYSHVSSELENLVALATRGLIRMFDEERQLFCHRLVRTDRGFVRIGHSPRYTIMTLLGLRELELSGGQSPFDNNALYKSFVADSSWISSVGDLGLLVWLTAVYEPEQLDELRGRMNLQNALEHYPDARDGRTMELAWCLAGLSHAAEAAPKVAGSLMDAALKGYRLLLENRGGHGYFGHLSTKKSIKGRLRGRIGSFADQIYPIYAMSKFAKSFHVLEALTPARECAKAICQAQGTLGQWWWLYDSQTGRVSSHYPVYSVHQHAMAPMGLFAMEAASGESYQDSVYKGLRWIYGANELGEDMRDCQENVVWRCVLPKNKGNKYREAALSLIGTPSKELHSSELEILHEDWPYELGWLLFAFAKKSVSEAENFSIVAPLIA